MNSDLFSQLQAEGLGHGRHSSAAFERADGAHLYGASGKAYIDFCADAGSMNYGHRPEPMRRALLSYLERGYATPSFDLVAATRSEFAARFAEVILRRRSLTYAVHFPGPTAAHALEAAFSLARRATRRRDIVAFAGSSHDTTQDEHAANGGAASRGRAREHIIVMPYCKRFETGLDSLTLLEALFVHRGAEGNLPAAVVLETLHTEGGLFSASIAWIRGIAELCKHYNVLLIVDDAQIGCGRTGPFFSFEPAGITPDIVCLSRSLSGYGLPLAITLVSPEIDIWSQSEHEGAIGGHNPAFATATAALDFWTDDALEHQVIALGSAVAAALAEILCRTPYATVDQRGRGLLRGLELSHPNLGIAVCRAAFERGLVIEATGPNQDVLRIAPPLTIARATLEEGLGILREALLAVTSTASSPELVTLAPPLRASKR